LFYFDFCKNIINGVVMSDYQYQMSEKLIDSISQNDISAVKAILKVPYYNSSILDKRQSFPLFFSTWCGKDEITKLLLDAGFDVNAIDEETGRTSIFNAESYKCMKDLIDAGADVNVQCNKHYNTVLHVKALHLQTVNLILESGFNVQLKNNYGWNILHYHTSKNHYWLINALLNAGVDIDDKTMDGLSVMDIAVHYEADECCAILERFKLNQVTNNLSPNHEGLGL